MADISILETDGAGDMVLITNDVAIAYGVENMPYLSMFGGRNWWGNFLLTGANQQFAAETEQVMLETALNSQGRVTIENAMKRDVQFLIDDIPGTTIDIQTRITDDNRLDGTIKLNGQEINSLWNPFVRPTRPIPIELICPLPTGLTLVDITAETVSATWPGTGSWRCAIFFDGLPYIGATTHDSSITIPGLDPETEYEFRLFMRCGPEDEPYDSLPLIEIFTTEAICVVPTGLEVDALSSTSVTVIWDDPGVSGLKYKWTLTTSPTPPSTAPGTGIEITAATATKTVAALAPSTHYYFWLRSKCTVTEYSAWIFTDFTTDP